MISRVSVPRLHGPHAFAIPRDQPPPRRDSDPEEPRVITLSRTMTPEQRTYLIMLLVPPLLMLLAVICAACAAGALSWLIG